MIRLRVTVPQFPILIYLLKIVRVLKSSYKTSAIIFEEYTVQWCYMWFTQSNWILFGFTAQLVFVTNASILHFNRQLIVMAGKNFLWWHQPKHQYVSIQSLWPLNGHLRYVQTRLILFSEIFRNGRNVDNVKTESTVK